MTEGLMISVDEVAEWLVSIGYGYDFQSTVPLPEALRWPLAEAYRRSEGCLDSVDDYYYTLKDEGAW